MIDGMTGRPFSAQTLVPPKPSGKSNRDKIIRISREKYCVEKNTIEEKIQRWSGLFEEKKEPVLFNSICSVCGKDVKVHFKPDGVRPVYCKDCFKKSKKVKKEDKENVVKVPVEKNKEKILADVVPEEKKIVEKETTENKKKVVSVDSLKKALEKALRKK